MPATTTERSTRREQLLDALVELFLAEGFRELQVADVAARLRCSKSTLYAIAPSKEQLVAVVVRAFFRRSTERVEARVAAAAGGQAERIRVYLGSIADELEPGSPAFFADLESHPLAREIYGRNTAIAAARIQELAAGIEGAAFLGYVAGITMEGIHRGEVTAAAGLDHFDAYRALARLIIATIETTSG
ncbi:MAG: TetR/AcrR family transcriptional regulator, partial [Actinomycetales bacterium]